MMMLLARKRTTERKGFVIQCNDSASDRNTVLLAIGAVMAAVVFYLLMRSAADRTILEFTTAYIKSNDEHVADAVADLSAKASEPISKAALEHIAERAAERAARTAARLAERIAAAD